MELFRTNRSVMIYNLDTLRKSDPLEWEDLHAQGITRLIAVPLRMDDRTIGFLGVDNPRYSIHDDSQIRVPVYFLVNRIRQDRNESRLRMLLRSDYRNILGNVGVGLWIILLDPETGADRCWRTTPCARSGHDRDRHAGGVLSVLVQPHQ